MREKPGLLALIASVCLAAPACVDPVHDKAVGALGGEAPGVRPGALHRPGQPCLTCHGDSGPASAEFTLGGTVYTLSKEDTPASGAVVRIEDITGTAVDVTTNAAGNFWVTPAQWSPTFPITTKVTLGPVSKQMSTHVGRAGSCADCHGKTVSPTSPGHVYLATSQAGLTGATP